MPSDAFFDPIVGRYIRERLARETQTRGAAARIAEVTKCSREHISNVADGTRGAGRAFAAAMAKYWGITQSELHRLAHKQYDTVLDREAPSHPELDAALIFCRGAYPEPFVTEFEQRARRQSDRPRLEWFLNLQVEFRDWVSRQTPATQLKHLHLLGVSMPHALPQTNRPS